MKSGYGENDAAARFGLWAAGVLLALSLALLASDYDSAMARVRGQGSWCERTGRTYNVNGDPIEEGQWWGADNKRHEVE